MEESLRFANSSLQITSSQALCWLACSPIGSSAVGYLFFRVFSASESCRGFDKAVNLVMLRAKLRDLWEDARKHGRASVDAALRPMPPNLTGRDAWFYIVSSYTR